MKIAEIKSNSYGERCYVILVSPEKFQKGFMNWKPLAFGLEANQRQAEYARCKAEKEAERLRIQEAEHQRKLAIDREKRKEKERQKNN